MWKLTKTKKESLKESPLKRLAQNLSNIKKKNATVNIAQLQVMYVATLQTFLSGKKKNLLLSENGTSFNVVSTF